MSRSHRMTADRTQDDAKVRSRGKPLVASINKLLDVEEHTADVLHDWQAHSKETRLGVVENEASLISE